MSPIEQAAQDTWNSTAYLFGGTPLPYDTGIAGSWRNIYVNQLTNMPPPTTREFTSVDRSGNRITVQFFETVRCEWDANAQSHWYKARPTDAGTIIAKTGQHQLFFGIDTYSWSIGQFGQAAQFAQAHNADRLLIKVADGGNVWYGGMDGWHNIRQAIQASGIDAIPYMYSYGNKFGALDTEIDILIAYMQDAGIVCADMEGEWNGQVQWAQHLCQRLQPIPGMFLVSTWADPSLQNWQGVIQALAPCTTVFMPQQYNNYLATFWAEFGANGATWLQPTVNLTQDFGANDPVTIASNAYNQGHTAIGVWYYDTATANPSLLDAVYAAFPRRLGGNISIEQAAQDTWNSTAYSFGGTPLPYDTDIARSWQNIYVNQLTNMPPPTTREFTSVDWSGNRITVQFFGTVRCEWDANAQPHWYNTGI